MIAMQEPPAIVRPAPELPPDIVAPFARAVAAGLETHTIGLGDYIREAWKIVEPGKEFLPNWHIDYIAEHLEAVTAGQIRRLLINMPPRYGKSFITSVAWPTWEWTTRPNLRYIFASYASSLSIKHNLDKRDIVKSDWYQKNWGALVKLAKDQDQKTEFKNTARGFMFATSTGGTVTGRGGDRIVPDDLINPEEAASRVARKAACAFYDRTLSTRLDDKKHGAIVAVEQRLGGNDLTAHLLKSEEWTHIKVPASTERQRTFIFPSSGRVKVMERDEVLCEGREDAAILLAQKGRMGTRDYKAQYEQEPTADEGGLLQRNWWKFYKPSQLPNVRRSIWFYDTAMEEGEENDYTFGIRINECDNGFYVDRGMRKRLQYPDLKRTVVANWEVSPADLLVIEDKVSGMSLRQDLQKTTMLRVVAFKTVRDKVFCVNRASPWCEAGKVFLPEGEPWVADFIEECAAFPNADHDDQPDGFAKAIMFLTSGPARAASAANYGTTPPAQPDWA